MGGCSLLQNRSLLFVYSSHHFCNIPTDYCAFINMQCNNYHLQRSWGKVIFSEVCVKNSVHGGCVWQGDVWQGGMCGRGHAWQGACMVGVCGRGHAWQGACMTGGMHGRAACMPGGVRHGTGGTHPTGTYSCYVIKIVNPVQFV